MKFQIENSQYVALRNGRVCFDCKSQCRIALNQRQFFNFHDIVRNINRLNLRAYPLDHHT